MNQFFKRLIHSFSPANVFFTYRGFYDVPEAMLAKINGRVYLFVRYFDEEQDDYDKVYTVYGLSGVSGLDQDRIWSRIEEIPKAELCKIPVDQIEFDPSRRAWMKSPLFDSIPATSTQPNTTDVPGSC